MTKRVPSPSMEAPPLEVAQWFNAKGSPTLESLRGQVVALHAFQMLCPGCVSHGIPQAQQISETFAERDVRVLGLHTVFEHHDAMTPTSLAAFLHEYRVKFAVAVDEPSLDGPVPRTMSAYGIRGTPSLILIARDGTIRQHYFGRVPDMALGAAIAALIAEPATLPARIEPCDDDACSIPSTAGTS